MQSNKANSITNTPSPKRPGLIRLFFARRLVSLAYLTKTATPDEQEAERQKEGGSFFYGFLIALAVVVPFWWVLS